MNLELISLDISNRCSKACSFCYNHSHAGGEIRWQPEEIVSFALDCADNDVKAVSFGGGEPFEYDGIFDVVSALTSRLFVTITSNGLPLLDKAVFECLEEHRPDKIHISIHRPEIREESERALFLVKKINHLGIRAGINLLVASSRIAESRSAVHWLYRNGISIQQIIFVPMKGKDAPNAKQLAEVAATERFQSTFCLTACQPSRRFCSISYDKTVNFCSYSPSRQAIEELTYSGMVAALNKIKNFTPC